MNFLPLKKHTAKRHRRDRDGNPDYEYHYSISYTAGRFWTRLGFAVLMLTGFGIGFALSKFQLIENPNVYESALNMDRSLSFAFLGMTWTLAIPILYFVITHKMWIHAYESYQFYTLHGKAYRNYSILSLAMLFTIAIGTAYMAKGSSMFSLISHEQEEYGSMYQLEFNQLRREQCYKLPDIDDQAKCIFDLSDFPPDKK